MSSPGKYLKAVPILAFCLPATAQIAAAQSALPFMDTVDVNVVNVEVMVTDLNGLPVTDRVLDLERLEEAES